MTARVRHPNRDYLLAEGPLEDAERTLHGADQGPNIWWPDDRRWIVVSEIDYAWSYVAGTDALACELLGHAGLEVLPTTLGDKPFYDSDLLNAALDG